ncbi:MAG: hypothetical protein O2951_17475 [Bacteroidetes bacterium]|nr:hypothetical protein [Bacteroidota bacterium]
MSFRENSQVGQHHNSTGQHHHIMHSLRIFGASSFYRLSISYIKPVRVVARKNRVLAHGWKYIPGKVEISKFLLAMFWMLGL